MKYIAISVVSALLLAPLGSVAKDSLQSSAVEKRLTQVPAAELPSAAAQLVKQAKARDWGTTTVTVVKTAVGINPAAAPAIVGAVAKSVPEMASVAAGTAAAEQPKLAAAIAKAASAAAPAKVEKIVEAVCRAVPNEFRAIAQAAAQGAPGSGKEVLKGVGAALPDLKVSINNLLAANGGAVPSVGAALDQASATTANGAVARGPSVGPPYVPYPGSTLTITPEDSGEVQPGGRDYAQP